jgi:hypothetical protein
MTTTSIARSSSAAPARPAGAHDRLAISSIAVWHKVAEQLTK